MNIVFALLLTVASSWEVAKTLADPLKGFEPYLGKTWKGAFAQSTPENPQYDVARWERALNGRAVRIAHSVNEGEYGGETFIVWDAKKQSLVFFYFTTAGYYTNGTVKQEGSKFISHEYVTGDADGTTEVRSTMEFLPGGRMHSKAEYFKNGRWAPGHELTSVEAPEARVVFR